MDAPAENKRKDYAFRRQINEKPRVISTVLPMLPMLLLYMNPPNAPNAPAQHADCNAAGDVNSIKVGENSNIQDNVVVHVAKHNAQDRALPTIIGNNVTIGALSSHAGLVPSEPAHLHVCFAASLAVRPCVC